MPDGVSITPELITGALVGLGTVGLLIRGVISGWQEARKTINYNEKQVGTMVTAIGVTWDRDQVERAIQALENLAKIFQVTANHTASIAAAQGVMSDKFQQTTQSKLDMLLDKLDEAEVAQTPVKKPRRRKPKPRAVVKSTV